MWRLATALAVLALICSGAQADVVTFELAMEFSGATAPEGPPPWLVVTLDDEGTPGSVDLTLDATGLTDAEYVKEWLLNLDPDLDPNALVFSEPIKTGMFDNPEINTGENDFMADGDGYFDIQFAFSQADGGDRRFGAGELVQYTISGIPGLTASSFDFLSEEDGNQGEFPTAAHVGAIGPDDDCSGWISVPEPTTLSLLLVAGLTLMRRRRP
jgi:hypothetical protein